MCIIYVVSILISFFILAKKYDQSFLSMDLRKRAFTKVYVKMLTISIHRCLLKALIDIVCCLIHGFWKTSLLSFWSGFSKRMSHQHAFCMIYFTCKMWIVSLFQDKEGSNFSWFSFSLWLFCSYLWVWRIWGNLRKTYN